MSPIAIVFGPVTAYDDNRVDTKMPCVRRVRRRSSHLATVLMLCPLQISYPLPLGHCSS